MAGGRRNLPRSTPMKPVPPADMRTKPGSEDRSWQVPCLQHVLIPDIPRDGELFFETLMVVFVCTGLGLQYLNMYRTIWWLPHSYTLYAMNLYLIDTDVTGFILTLLCRRFLWAVLKHMSLNFLPRAAAQYMYLTSRILVLLTTFSLLSWFTYQIFMKHHIVHILYLYYLIVVYFIIFGLTMEPFLDLIPEYSKIRQGTSVTPRPIYHACSPSPEGIRQEVEVLKGDFNVRIKQSLFNALMVGYYVGIIPLFFAQNTLQYDTFWVGQHAVFVFLASMTLYLVYCFPPRYCDILHRAALHLGTWSRVDDRRAHISFNPWNREQLWSRGVLTKHSREFYRCDAPSAAAEPGNAHHERFYMLFCNPSGAQCFILGLQVCAVLSETLLLIRAVEWYQLISGSILLFVNFYPLFKLFRDYLILCKIYKAERLILEKQAPAS
ncbi:Transmembrane protein 39A [Amphibalanus amphitrite]|uniref:Transmembrane protein 39A n=1 Tax=Amphibalanus amphitrite TaxID=1232801 RepID=A0A6A4X5E8_AMPAM|nr:Transmembrane protein 39A [Amphibalanus amphitrite]